jgi:ParB family chromosome partitioning protein
MTQPTTSFKTIQLEHIKPDPDQPRKTFGEGDLQRLSMSLKTQGQLVPLVVVEQAGSYILIDGERRFRASEIAGLGELRCIVLSKKPNADEMLTIQLTINTQRQDLNPIEKMSGYHKLMQLKGWNSAQLAEHLSVSKSMVTRVLALGKLSTSEQLLVAEGVIGSADAYALSRLNDEARETANRLAKEGKLGRDTLERLARKKSDKSSKSRTIRLELGAFKGSFQTEQAIVLSDLIDWLDQAIRECKRAAKKGLDVTTLAKVLADRSRFERQGGKPC